MKNYFNFSNNRNTNTATGKKSNQSSNSSNGRNSSFLKKLLALSLFIIACLFIWSGVMLPYSMVFINILLVISGIFILLICSDLIDQINHFGKYNENDDNHCEHDHSDGIDNDYGGSNDYGYGGNYLDYRNSYPYGDYQDNYRTNDYQINSYPNNDFSDYNQYNNPNKNEYSIGNQIENDYPNPVNKPQQLKDNNTSKPDDKDYSQLED